MVREPTDAEKIGAVIDGTAGQERDALLARLAADDDDYDVFVDTAAVLRELEDEAESAAPEIADAAPEIVAEAKDSVPVAEVPAMPSAHELSSVAEARAPVTPAAPTEAAGTPEPDGVISLRPRRSVWTSPATRWLAAAAVLVAVAVPVLRSRASADAWRDPRTVGPLAMNGDPLPAGLDSMRPWVVFRGGGSGEPLKGSSARVGTLHADLVVAATAEGTRKVAVVQSLAASAVGTIRSINQTSSDFVISEYEKVGARADAPRSQLLSTLNTAREEATKYLDSDYFALGAWTEAARLAASRQNAAFFSSKQTRRALDQAVNLEGLDADAKTAARAVASLVESAGGIHDWTALNEHLLILHRALVNTLDDAAGLDSRPST